MYHRPTSHSGALGPGCAGPSLAIPTTHVFDQPPGTALHAPTSGAPAFLVEPSALANHKDDPKKHTTTPYVTGTSVLAMTFADGVMLACDTLGAYGSTKRYKSVDRIKRINNSTIIGASGELSDFNYILTLLDEMTTEDFCYDDGVKLQPHQVYAYLTRVLYNRRNKFDPLWNSLVVAGLQEGKPFLGTVGMIGTHYTDAHIATGFGNHLARPLFREKHRPDMSEQEATDLIHEALRVCYYRDKNSINKFRLAKVTSTGVSISDPFALETKWDFQAFIDPSKNAPGTW